MLMQHKLLYQGLNRQQSSKNKMLYLYGIKNKLIVILNLKTFTE